MSIRRPCRPTATAPHARSRALLGLLLLVLALHIGLGSFGPRSAHPATNVRNVAALKLDPNVASKHELMLLPRIGPRLAEVIVAHRAAAETAPAFVTPEDLDDVRGIGPATVAGLRPYLRFPTVDVPAQARLP